MELSLWCKVLGDLVIGLGVGVEAEHLLQTSRCMQVRMISMLFERLQRTGIWQWSTERLLEDAKVQI